jgi:hypothetical protein
MSSPIVPETMMKGQSMSCVFNIDNASSDEKWGIE